VVLFVGRVDPIKGIETLIDAAAQLSTTFENLVVLFVGGELDDDGQPAGALKAVAERAALKGLSDVFHFVGSQPQDRLPDFYSASDVVAVPSRYESFGLVAVEAMACGTPVVASRVGGLSFTVEEGVSGFLVAPNAPGDFATAISAILTDENLQQRLQVRSRESAERFAWPLVASQMVHVYQRLADGNSVDLCCADDLYA
jgi:D-inositol-3-phosphate glycosyltransferase